MQTIAPQMPSAKIFLLIATLSYALGAACLAANRIQTSTVCAEEFCTHTVNLKVGDSNIFLGLAIPPADSGLSELMINASVPLPYGFLSFSMGDISRASTLSLAELGIFFTEVDDPMPMNISNLRSQVGTASGGSLVTNPNAASTTISAKSAQLPDQLQIVSRIQSPLFKNQEMFTSPSAVLQVTLSMNAPSYLDSGNETASLDLKNSDTASFVFERSAGSFSNYTEMVKVVGL